jgi:hypothetical protein
LALTDFENWIANKLETWLDGAEKTDSTCTRLHDLIDKYLSIIMVLYRGCAERFSLGILTTMELWVVLDKIQCALNPLLSRFTPGISPKTLETLVLRKRGHIHRLLAVEQHLKYRYRPCTTSMEFFSNMERFSMDFFDESKPHQRKRATIEGDAASKSQQKTAEWQDMKERYESSLQEAKDLECDYTRVNNQAVHDDTACEKCKLQSEAADMKIAVYESPLPEDRDLQKVLVVELNPPTGFRAWRDATWRIIQDLGREEVIQPKSKDAEKKGGSKKEEGDLFLPGYNPLSSYGSRGNARIMLRASKKPSQLHGRKTKKMPIELKDVCMSNASRWAFYDKHISAWISDQKAAPSFHGYCVYELPEGPYRHLQWVMSSTDYSDNQVLAKQANCPSNLNLHEHYVFGSLRAGRRLQLMNILRALASQDLNLKNAAVQTLILQVLWEVGASYEGDDIAAPEDSCLRVSHAEFGDTSFCRRLLQVLETITNQMTASRSERNIDALISIVMLALRTLSLTTSHGIRAVAAESLRRFRRRFMTLLKKIARSRPSLSTNDTANASRMLLFKAAGLVKMTFDVDACHIDSVLRDHQDVEAFITASLLVSENVPIGKLQPNVKEILLRGFEISKAVEDVIRRLIPQCGQSLTTALLTRCEGLHLEDNWFFCSGNDNPWVESLTLAPNSKVVHLNILTGEILLEGRNIQKVPPEIEQDSLYQQVFSQVSVSRSLVRL